MVRWLVQAHCRMTRTPTQNSSSERPVTHRSGRDENLLLVLFLESMLVSMSSFQCCRRTTLGSLKSTMSWQAL